jgi:hypothetical protein
MLLIQIDFICIVWHYVMVPNTNVPSANVPTHQIVDPGRIPTCKIDKTGLTNIWTNFAGLIF